MFCLFKAGGSKTNTKRSVWLVIGLGGGLAFFKCSYSSHFILNRDNLFRFDSLKLTAGSSLRFNNDDITVGLLVFD